MNRHIKTFLLIAGVCLFVILFHYMGLLKPVEVFLRQIVNPLSQDFYQWSVSVDDDEHTFDSVEELQESYKTLLEKNTDQQIDATRIVLLEEEVVELKETLSFVGGVDYTYVTTPVTGQGVDPVGKTLIIGVGDREGVRVGDPVIVRDGILIGKVADVQPRTAIVRLLSDSQSKVGGTVMNGEKSIGVVEGGYGLSIRMNFIPQNEEVSIDDVIVTSGLETDMPAGLVVGTVAAVERKAHDPFQSAIVRPMQDLDHVTVVTVLLSQ